MMEPTTPKVSPFTQAVVAAMQFLYPEELADPSFDNIGLLLEAPYRPHLNNSALITVDLTAAVADEAIERKDSIVVAYHPIIFHGIKSLTQSHARTNTLLRLAQEGISVYCPHTAVDATPGGLNDWLADILCKGIASSRKYITPIPSPPLGYENTGYGRILTFQTPRLLSSLITLITCSLGIPSVSVATPQSIPYRERAGILITTVGICAGSGGTMLNDLDVDLLFTGELSHHETLSAIENGRCVITTFHSNSERAFFRDRMQQLLSTQVWGEIWSQSEPDKEFQIAISEVDADPFEIVVPEPSMAGLSVS
ncbi:NIF3 NGG1 interactin-like proteing factor 3-like 1 [Amylocarpus encephaloides]|uniref:NIF3 NGG1 interactin-like proteing factor 3-like 1 n=1 Tax=Amylocarpus encephaloides TaxID=45428 RepID=A0A9P7YBY4_9HELO|nr:NIF3 NGG1 interactin-like proteing factor 3-like 1 [Amylocarpus encephaloides]